MPNLIISDMDGTLTATSKTAARVASISDKWGIPLSNAVIGLLKTGNTVYRTLGEEFEKTYGFRQKVYNRLGAEQPDSMFLLTAAFDQNIPCAVLSNGPREWGLRVMRRHDMHYFVDQAVFREDMPALKPDPRCISPIMKAHEKGLPEIARIWVFGDRETDVRLADNANVESRHHFIPVAIEGTPAANLIRARKERGYEGLTFRDHFAMACHIRPEAEASMEKLAGTPLNIPEHVASYGPI